jgi:hypothetical protein
LVVTAVIFVRIGVATATASWRRGFRRQRLHDRIDLRQNAGIGHVERILDRSSGVTTDSPPRPCCAASCACATLVVTANSAAAIIAIRIIFFAGTLNGSWEFSTVRASDAYLPPLRQDCDISYGRAKTRATANFVATTA